MAKKKFKEYRQGIFKPLNPEKCLNTGQIVYRSHLEFRFLKMCDKNSLVVEWSSEAVIIPYNNPVKGRLARYYIDAYLKMKTPDGFKKFLIEIKPEKQTKAPTVSKRKKKSTVLYENAMYAVNTKKWEAAEEFAKKRKMQFMIITEKDIDKMEGR